MAEFANSIIHLCCQSKFDVIALADGLNYVRMDFTIILMQLVFSFVSFFVDV